MVLPFPVLLLAFILDAIVYLCPSSSGSFYTSRKCRQPAPLVPSLPDLPPPPPKGTSPPPTMSPVSPLVTGSSRERPRSLLLMTGNDPNRRKQGQSSVGNHDNSGVVNLTEDELVNNVNTDQGAIIKSADKVSNSVVNPNSLEHGVPQDTLEPLLASIAVPHIAAISPGKDGSSSSNGSDDFGQPASNVEPRPTVHPGFELAGQYPSTMVRAAKDCNIGDRCECPVASWCGWPTLLSPCPSHPLPPSLFPPPLSAAACLHAQWDAAAPFHSWILRSVSPLLAAPSRVPVPTSDGVPW